METNTMEINSPVFETSGNIPAVYTCQGRNISPALHFKGVPLQAKSLVLIMEDPDAPDPKAPKMTWDHWLLYNIPSNTTSILENADSHLPKGSLAGLNSWNKTGYGGPCPPIGRHRYYFKLYALEVMLSDLHEPDKNQLLQAMQGHIIAQAQLIGTYQKAP